MPATQTVIDADNMPDFLWAIRDNLKFPLSFANRSGGFQAWRTDTRQAVKAAIGGDFDAIASCSIVSEHQFPAHKAARLTLGFSTGATAPAYLLTPNGPGPHPAVLLLHDHGSEFSIGKEKLVAPWDAPALLPFCDLWVERFYGGRYLGDELVRQGYVVLVVDALGWGERHNNGYASQQALAANLMQFGLSLAGVIATEDAQAVNLLATLPGVDATRIATMGLSMGGYRSWQLAALSPVVRASVAVCWMGRLKDLMVPGNNQLRGQSAFNMLHPGLGGKLDYPDFAGLCAPKPLLVYAGREDGLFSGDAVQGAFDDLAAIWAGADASAVLSTKLWPGGHAFNQTQQAEAFAWLSAALA